MTRRRVYAAAGLDLPVAVATVEPSPSAS